MATSVPCPVFRQGSYRGWRHTRLWRDGAVRLAGAAGALFALALGGCSYQLESLSAKRTVGALETTGSIGGPVESRALATLPPENDLAHARAAVTDVLNRGGEDSSVPWENPRTGARGTITPLAQAYDRDGLTCRDFLASYVRDGSESWMQGEACRAGKGRWQVRHLKPWQRT